MAFAPSFYREGLISPLTVARFLAFQLFFSHFGPADNTVSRIRKYLLTITKGWQQDEVIRIVDQTLNDVLPPIVYPQCADLIRQHNSLGRRTYIVSVSPQEVADPIARYLGVDGAIASRAVVGRDGRYTGEMELYAYGPHKARAIGELSTSEGIDLDVSYAYSDSQSDLPMLEIVGHPVAVNPDRTLARIANERGWETRRFSRPHNPRRVGRRQRR